MTRRFYGKVGFGISTQVRPGVWEDQIVERPYYGDIQQNLRRLDQGDRVNDNISLQNTLSIVADEYLNEHFHAIRYVEYAGGRWKVDTVTVRAPRLLLRIGEVYHGPAPSAA